MYTVVVAALLFGLFLIVVSYSYKIAKDNGFESLHIQTKEIKEDIELQIVSDCENLQTMANFAAKLYSDGEGYDLLLNSFKAIGLIENIGILLPDNTLVTRTGAITAPDELSFEKEKDKGAYISGRVNDVTPSKREVVRSSVPIKADGETVGILYGIINLETLEKRMLENASVQNTQIFIVERGNGNFIVDTINKNLGNISLLETREFVDGYSYEEIYSRVIAGNNGYTAFVSQIIEGTTLYLHHSPLEIGDWHIMLAEPEESVFYEAVTTGRTMAAMFSGIVLIMSLYLWIIFSGERRENRMHLCASKIRKLLLGINQQSKSVNDALENIARFAASRSAFFVDTDGEDYHYIFPSVKSRLLDGDDRAYFVSRIINYTGKIAKSRDSLVNIVKLTAESYLADEEPEFFEFMKKHSIKSIVFAGITNKNNHISILGAINPRQPASVQMLLEDISVCFSMAIYNKKYLMKTEAVAATDSLTGLSNRMAYKKDLAKFDQKHSENFSCIYIDVNELHVINNKYGHAAGDGMLLFIANVLREVFTDSSIYRIGGDEFLVFSENKSKEDVEEAIKLLNSKVEEMNYHISIGMDFCKRNVDTEELVTKAEKRMYEEKAKYYQKKEQKIIEIAGEQNIERISTGIREFDALLSILSRRYHGIYCVSLNSGMARRILMPSYLKQFSEEMDTFKDAFTFYVREMVHPDCQRAMLSFLNYDVIRRQLAEGNTPAIEYTKMNGEKVVLRVYKLPGFDVDTAETMWVFETQN